MFAVSGVHEILSITESRTTILKKSTLVKLIPVMLFLITPGLL